MTGVWTFTILYLGLIAGTLALLAAVVWYLANRRRPSFDDLVADALATSEPGADDETAPDWESRLACLETKVAELLAQSKATPPLKRVWRPAGSSCSRWRPVKPAVRDQASALRDEYRRISRTQATSPVSDHSDIAMAHPGVQEQIYNGFVQGRSITALARETGRGLGEVELVINLRRAVADRSPQINDITSLH